MSLLLLLRTREAPVENTIELGFVENQSTVFSIAATQEQTISLGFVENSSTVYSIVFNQEQSIVLGFVTNSSTVFSLLFNNGDVVVLDHMSLPDLIVARLHPIYGNGLESLNSWMLANGYDSEDLPTVFGLTATETMNDAAYRYFREEFVG